MKNNRGMVWGLSKIAVLLGAIMLFTILWSYHLAFGEINCMDAVVHEARNMADLIDSVGSSPSACELTYETPERLCGKSYSIEIRSRNLTLSMDSGIASYVTFFSGIDGDFSCVGGHLLRIKKYNGTVSVY